MKRAKWYEKSYCRNLLDMHIEDWDEGFLSRYDPKEYVRLLKVAGVQSTMVYANSHVGYCYWPTESGQMHRGLRGRDVLGEFIELAHAEKMDVILYYTLVFNNWAYAHDPGWRALTVDGKGSREEGVEILTATHGRYGICCPNSPGYRAFVEAQVGELCRGYLCEGVFFDMTFWPFACYCPECRKRFRDEAGAELPERIDWHDPVWRSFQARREEWLAEFASFTTGVVRRFDPGVTVEHQSSTFPFDWSAGVTEGLIPHSDYVGGDFYGGLLQQSFICKLYHNVTPHRPFEFMTSRCFPDLRDHSTLKSRELLKLEAALTLAHGGAFFLIDAIDPVGTVNAKVYAAMGEVFRFIRQYEPHLGGDLCQDIAIYFSMRSKVDPADNGRRVAESSLRAPHVDAVLGAARILKERHLPFGVISKPNIDDLSRHQVLVLPDMQFMDDEEAAAIRRFVERGGGLYASGRSPSPVLEDLLGIRYRGETSHGFTYIAPTEQGVPWMPGVTAEYPLTIAGRQVKADVPPGSEVLATITLPFTDPADRSRFASIHSNPPGVPTDLPAIVLRRIGKGRAVWVSTPLEKCAQEPNRNVFAELIRGLASKPLSFEVDAPPAVEAVLFHQRNRARLLLSLVNEQELLPAVRASGVAVRVRTGAKKVVSVALLPGGRKLAFAVNDGNVEVRIPAFDTLCMLGITYRERR